MGKKKGKKSKTCDKARHRDEKMYSGGTLPKKQLTLDGSDKY